MSRTYQVRFALIFTSDVFIIIALQLHLTLHDLNHLNVVLEERKLYRNLKSDLLVDFILTTAIIKFV